jgi:serine/threonine protein kinase
MPPRELTDDYRLERILSSGRGGSILRASRIDNGQAVVVKLINVPAAADPALAPKIAARFQAYAAGLAGLRHPNLPLVLDSGLTPDGGAFLVMEKLDGIGFDADLAPSGAGASPDRILPLLAQALAGLEELARHGLAHLNLCPENLLLVPAAASAALPAIGGPDGAAQTVKLLGLGTPLFHLGAPWPEPSGARFRAPELAMPPAARETMPDWRADCYALAMTACYALGATVAFGEVAGTAVHAVQMPLALSFELANDEALRQILERCLRQSPGERPRSPRRPRRPRRLAEPAGRIRTS